MSIESREKKTQIIGSLEETFYKCSIGILTDYRGLATPEMTALRRRLQQSGSEYKVIKNTLARFAAERIDMDDLAGAFEGPIAIAFGYSDDVTTTAKVLVDYIRDSRAELTIKGGFLGDRLLTSSEVRTLATLPSREIMLARVLGQMQSPVSSLLSCLSAPMRGVLGVLQARIKQLEGE
jgi:large subunit ribosomal protein L10